MLAASIGLGFAQQLAATTLDFDDLVLGSVVSGIGPVTFTSNTGLPLVVSSRFETTSGTNYLGVDDGGFEVFFPGDVIRLEFVMAIRELKAAFVASPNAPGAVFHIEAGSATADSALVPDFALSDGGEVYSVRLVLARPSTFAELRADVASDIYSFNVDDIVFAVDEPGVFALLLIGVCVAALQRATRSKPTGSSP